MPAAEILDLDEEVVFGIFDALALDCSRITAADVAFGQEGFEAREIADGDAMATRGTGRIRPGNEIAHDGQAPWRAVEGAFERDHSGAPVAARANLMAPFHCSAPSCRRDGVRCAGMRLTRASARTPLSSEQSIWTIFWQVEIEDVADGLFYAGWLRPMLKTL